MKLSGCIIQRNHFFSHRYGIRSRGKRFWYDDGVDWKDVNSIPSEKTLTKVGSLYVQLARMAMGITYIGLPKPVSYTKRAKRIVIHPGVSHVSNGWCCYPELIARLAEMYDGNVVVVGHEQDSNLVRSVIKSIPEEVANRIQYEKTENVMNLAAVIDSAELFIGNNSGPLHVAAEMGVKTLSIAGPSPSIWFPVHGTEDSGRHSVIVADLECCGCDVPSRCPYGLHCFKVITVDDVIECVKGIVLKY